MDRVRDFTPADLLVSGITDTPAVKTSNEYLAKILVIGDINTGKTSFVRRSVHNTFSKHYKSTIGVDMAMKAVRCPDGSQIRLSFWDIAGQERFGNMTRMYYKGSHLVIVMYDIKRLATFENAAKWIRDIRSKTEDDEQLDIILVGSKYDLIVDEEDENEMCVSHSEIQAFSRNNGIKSTFFISSMTNFGIDNLIDQIVKLMLVHPRVTSKEEKKKDVIDLAQSDEEIIESESGSKWCC